MLSAEGVKREREGLVYGAGNVDDSAAALAVARRECGCQNCLRLIDVSFQQIAQMLLK